MKPRFLIVFFGVLLLSLGVFQTVFADQFWIIIHHEDQGTPGDKRFEKCMPEDAWNGHDDHTGDWRSAEVYSDNKCEEIYVPPVEGCTDKDADNYNPDATVDDGSCTYPPDEVCTDETANNVGQPLPCEYDPPVCVPEDYNGEAEGCGEPPEVIYGCMDEDADNYNSSATVDDGSCTYPPDEVCTDETANNVGQPLPCEYDPPVCEPEDYNGEEEGCGEPPVDCVAPNVLVNGVCTTPTDSPVIVVTPTTGTSLDVPTCEEMSKMSSKKFSRWTVRWDRLGCYNQGYQTGSGSIPFGLIFGVLGAVLVVVGLFIPDKKIKLVD